MDSEQELARLQNDFGTSEFDANWIAMDWNWWDQVGYGAVSAFNYFSQVAGALDPQLTTTVKTTEQTNLVVANQIGGAECFVVTAIRCFVLNSCRARQLGTNVSTDTLFSARQLAFSRFFAAAMNTGVFKWTINQKQYLIETLPWQVFPAGFGLGIVFPPANPVAAGTGILGGSNFYMAGSPFDIDNGKRGDTFSLGQPVFLAPSTQFQVSINFPLAGTAPAATNIYGASADQTATVWTGVVLCGQKVRPRG